MCTLMANFLLLQKKEPPVSRLFFLQQGTPTFDVRRRVHVYGAERTLQHVIGNFDVSLPSMKCHVVCLPEITPAPEKSKPQRTDTQVQEEKHWLRLLFALLWHKQHTKRINHYSFATNKHKQWTKRLLQFGTTQKTSNWESCFTWRNTMSFVGGVVHTKSIRGISDCTKL